MNLSDMSVTGRSLFQVILKIAASNHYMVGLVGIEGVSFDDFSDANQMLITLENADTKQTHRYDLAFNILDEACFKAHHTHLNR